MPYKNTQSKEAKESQRRRNKTYYEKSKGKEVKKTIPENKKCSSCGETKNWEEFHLRKDRASGLTSWCKECLKEHADKYSEKARMVRRMRDFNITEDEIKALYDKHNCRCAICGIEESKTKKKSLCIDHDHKTGKIRGLLCDDCNVGLGRFKDDVENLGQAMKYLNKHN